MTRATQLMAGVMVLDLTQIYNGPYATFLMAMAGAEVIKIEPPEGEHLRRRAGRSGAGIPFAMLNANKRSVSLDLKTDRGRAILLDLARQADVLVENFAPGVVDRLRIGHEQVREVNPRIVYASGSGYGQTGRYRAYPAMDLTVQAMSGIMSTTGFPDSPPVKAGGAVCDFFGGIHLFGAISTALFHRERTGEGSYIDVSMMESVYPAMASNVGMALRATEDESLRTGNRHGGLSLCPYNVYRASDGYIAIICNNQTHWRALLAAMERPELDAVARFATVRDRVQHMAEVDALVESWTLPRERAGLFDRLIEHRVPCAPVRELTEVLHDEHLHERGMLLEVEHPELGPIVTIRSPIRVEGHDFPDYQAEPACGADTDAVLTERLGVDADSLERLKRDGVVAAP